MRAPQPPARRQPALSPVPAALRLVAGIALALLSLALLVLALPPTNLWPLIALAFVPMLVALHRVLPRPLASLAPAITFAGYAGFFLNAILDNLPALPASLRVLPLLLLGLLIGLLARDYRSFHARTGYRWLVLHGIVSWLGFELIFSWIPYTATWPFVGNALFAQPWLLQPISLLGMFALDGLILLLNYSLGLATLAAIDRRWRFDADQPPVPPRLAGWWLGVAGGLLGAWVVVSLALFRTPTGPTVRVAALQPNQEAFLPPGGRREPDRSWQVAVDRQTWPVLLAQTRAAARQGAQVIVWPEGAFRFDPQRAHTAELQALARETRAYLTLPYVVATPQGLRNEAALVDPQGHVLGVYRKSHPVPGEVAVAQRAYPVYRTPLGRLATMICYDLDFLDTARATAARGAQLVAAPSADWPAISRLHYTHLVFRAVETRQTMLKADWSFDSAIIDPYGRILVRSVSLGGTQATLIADVPLGSGRMLATRVGDGVGWAGLAGMVSFALAMPLSKRRDRRQAAGQRGDPRGLQPS